MTPGSNQMQLSASSRGIVDHFFCFACDEYVWDCDHLSEERITAPRAPAVEGGPLQSFTYDGKAHVLEIEFRVTVPYAYDEIPLPPPPRVIQYFEAPKYVVTKILGCKTARSQERFWQDHIRTRFQCQTVRTVCRLPRIRRFTEARNIHPVDFENYSLRLASEERKAFQVVLASMKALLLQILSPKRAAGLGGLLQCPSCESVGADVTGIRHRNCLWSALAQSAR